MEGTRSDARFCSARCRKRWHRRPAELRVEFVAHPWLPASDEQIEHERKMLATARRQTRVCGCESPIELPDLDGHTYCLKCSWPLERHPGLIHHVFRLIARLARHSRPEAMAPQQAV